MRLLVIGNSGSGKSTFARRIAAETGAPMLELDLIVWEPHRIAVARPIEQTHADLDAFLAAHETWVIEGCDGDLIERAAPAATELVLLDPGRDACLANNRRRPWEPRKYDSAADQERMLPMLLGWVASYYTRTDPRSLAYHRRVLEAFPGPKRTIVTAS